MTEPSGAFAEWKAHSIGRKAKENKIYLEENYEDDLEEDELIWLAIRTLLESVENEKSMEICVVRARDSETLSEIKIGGIVA